MTHITAGTLSALLRNCKPLPSSSAHHTKQTHLQIIVRGFLPHVTLQTDLLLAYSKCDHLETALQIFDQMPDRNMHSWNILISSLVQKSLHHQCLATFQELLKSGLHPDHYTFPSLFKACAGVQVQGNDLYRLGRALHSWVNKLGFNVQVVVGCSILDFYAKGGNLVDANRMFVEMGMKDTVVWNTMISGFSKAGFSVEALGCFRRMYEEGVKMDSRTIPSILIACGKEGDLRCGKEIHGQLVKSIEFSGDIAIGNSLIDMYSKCGCLHISQKVFDNMARLNLITWTTLISCYGVHGKGEESLHVFEKMRVCGLSPNSITFTAVLASCSHSGLVDQGRELFEIMTSEYGISPSAEHYACMVDLLGRAGNLEEALNLVKKMPREVSPSVWGALLGACRIHNNVLIGETAAYRLFELEAGNPSNYIALCSIYESVGKSHGISRIRARMREMGLIKKPGCSWITINGTVRSFYQGDVSHVPTKILYETLDEMIKTILTPDGYGLINLAP